MSTLSCGVLSTLELGNRLISGVNLCSMLFLESLRIDSSLKCPPWPVLGCQRIFPTGSCGGITSKMVVAWTFFQQGWNQMNHLWPGRHYCYSLFLRRHWTVSHGFIVAVYPVQLEFLDAVPDLSHERGTIISLFKTYLSFPFSFFFFVLLLQWGPTWKKGSYLGPSRWAQWPGFRWGDAGVLIGGLCAWKGKPLHFLWRTCN